MCNTVVKRGSRQVLSLFVANDVRVVTHLLNTAAKQENLDVITAITDLSPYPLRKSIYNTMMFYAVCDNHMEVMEYLLSEGADVNSYRR